MLKERHKNWSLANRGKGRCNKLANKGRFGPIQSEPGGSWRQRKPLFRVRDVWTVSVGGTLDWRTVGCRVPATFTVFRVVYPGKWSMDF